MNGRDAVVLGVDEYTDAMLQGVDVLPQKRLEQLAAHGWLISVKTFADHMRPDVHWIEPEEFGTAFNELIKGSDGMAGKDFEAAFTDPAPVPHPAFINARRGTDPGTVDITVRSNAADGGLTGKITMDLQDFDQWLADLQLLRRGYDA